MISCDNQINFGQKLHISVKHFIFWVNFATFEQNYVPSSKKRHIGSFLVMLQTFFFFFTKRGKNTWKIYEIPWNSEITRNGKPEKMSRGRVFVRAASGPTLNFLNSLIFRPLKVYNLRNAPWFGRHFHPHFGCTPGLTMDMQANFCGKCGFPIECRKIRIFRRNRPSDPRIGQNLPYN